jgi:hypothetical protein
MAGEEHDKTKVDPKNVIGLEYDDVPEDKHQTLEAHLQEYTEECKRRMVSCFGKTRQGVVEKEKFIMPMFPSKVMSNVRSTSPRQLSNQFASIMGDKIAESNKITTDLLLNLTDQMQVLTKGKSIDHSYSTETINPSSSAMPASALQPLYCMPPNYFARQTPPPPLV